MSLVAFSPGTVTLTLRDADQTQQLVLSVGTPGPAGPAGANGAPGVGVPAGGSAGQALVKSTGVDYETEWATPASDDKLPLAGGTMDEGATIVLSTATYDSLVSGEVFGVELTADPTQNASLGFNAVTVQDGVGSMQMRADGLTFPDATTQATAGLPLTGGTMSGAIVFDAVGLQNINKGTFDNSTGGYNGISLTCAVGYELNWQGGHLANWYSGAFQPITVDSALNITDAGGITFPDATQQTTAFPGFTGYAPLNAPYFTSGITADGGVTVPGPSGSYVITYSGIQFPDSTTQTTAAVAGANFGDAFTLGKVYDVSPSGGAGGFWTIYFAPMNAAVAENGVSVSLSDGTSSEDVLSGGYSTNSSWSYTTTTLANTDYIYITYNSQRSSIPISQP